MAALEPTPAEVCPTCGVRERAVCGVLSGPELRTLSSRGRRRRLERGETLSWAGDEAAACANLIEGVLKLTAVDRDGRERIVGLLYPGDFIGRPFAAAPRENVVALTAAEVCTFARSDFEGALARLPHMGAALLRRTLDALDHSRMAQLLVGQRSAAARVAGLLLDLAGRAAAPGCPTSAAIPLPLTRGEMAEALGLTIETVSRQMTRLRAGRVIATPTLKSFTVLDRAALEREATA